MLIPNRPRTLNTLLNRNIFPILLIDMNETETFR